MTKTLTEQWRDGELPSGYYYLTDGKETYIHECFNSIHKIVPSRFTFLSPVPSYDEWKQAKENLDKNGTWYTERSYKLIEKKLEIATKALIDYANRDEWELIDSKNVYWSRKRFPYPWRIAGKALKEMEGVK